MAEVELIPPLEGLEPLVPNPLVAVIRNDFAWTGDGVFGPVPELVEKRLSMVVPLQRA